ncbi:MAG TPA: GNAT family N-acetyltransferase, partial [Candidatus Polarisedimenticolaceae bacterium]|nr:GNAT family N-acetyltransferase [Candidatus Polarisedimenticolaceae bacterium]
RCCLPHDPGGSPLTIAQFKQEIRELDLWCSSCMVGFEGDQPVAVVIGCKRPPYTLVRGLGVHPDHLFKGHGRHLLTSLSSKLAILGPPRLVAEVPVGSPSAVALFEACGWNHDRTYTDFVLAEDGSLAPAVYGAFTPVGFDDLPDAIPAPESEPAWECSAATIEKRREHLRGLALISAKGIEAGALYTTEGSFVSVWASQGEALAPVVREIQRLENARAVVRGSQRELAGFRAAREVWRFSTAARPA